MQSRIQVVLSAGAVGLIVGLGVASLLGVGRAGPRPTASGISVAAAEKPSSPQSPLVVGLSAGDKLSLLAMIREELKVRAVEDAPARPSEPSREEQAPQGPALEDLSSQQIARYEQGRALVESAVARGTWTTEDRDQLHERLSSLPGEMRLEVARPIIVAVNREEMRFFGDGPVF